ncbi:MAG: ferrochelatase [Bacteroidetes bacterium]|nr:ferrochelatase [Bacteroidota bacterium]
MTKEKYDIQELYKYLSNKPWRFLKPPRFEIKYRKNNLKQTNIKIAVILLNMGGPDSLETIEPFLNNLFKDPDIFKIPFGQKLFAKVISKLRTKKVVEQYKQIGGKSPQNEHTETQRKLLENSLRNAGVDVDVLVAMRYWKPLTNETVNKVNSVAYDKIILLPLYPHFSSVTTGSSFNEWWRHFNGDKSKVIQINNFHTEHKYLSAISERIDECLKQFPEEAKDNIELLFSAHSVPQSLIANGDPYQEQILESIRLIMELRNNSEKHHISYQSKVGPVKWLVPSTEEKIAELGKSGIKNLLVIPISFVSDHIETLFELGIEYRKVAEENGITNYKVMTGLNDSQLFIEQLHQLVLNELNNE